MSRLWYSAYSAIEANVGRSLKHFSSLNHTSSSLVSSSAAMLNPTSSHFLATDSLTSCQLYRHRAAFVPRPLYKCGRYDSPCLSQPSPWQHTRVPPPAFRASASHIWSKETLPICTASAILGTHVSEPRQTHRSIPAKKVLLRRPPDVFIELLLSPWAARYLEIAALEVCQAGSFDSRLHVSTWDHATIGTFCRRKSQKSQQLRMESAEREPSSQ